MISCQNVALTSNIVTFMTVLMCKQRCVGRLSQVEKELKEICRDVLDILDKHLIPAATTGESKVFYYKMYVQ